MPADRPTAAPPRRRPVHGVVQAAPADAPSVPDAARLGLGPCARAQRTTLELAPDLPLTAWLRVGSQLLSVRDSSTWWSGDWLVYGSETYPRRYRDAIERTALDYQTLRNYAWVARKFPAPRRRQELSFQHHQEVAALPPDQQDLWLDRSVEHGWSKAELRRRLRADAAGGVLPSRGGTRLSVEIPEERLTVWRQAAEKEDKEVADWLVAVADRAARTGR